MGERRVTVVTVLLLACSLVAGLLGRVRETGDRERGDAAVAGLSGGTGFAPGITVPVRGSRIRRDTLVLWIEAEGTVEARRRTAVRAGVSGPVVQVAVREGARVGEGQLLARIDSTAAALEVRRAEAERDRARAEFLGMVLGADGLELSENVRQERRRHARVRSGLARAAVELAKARRELAGTRVRAPFAGRVADLAVIRGSRVQAGDPVATVLDLSLVEVDVGVLQERVPHLRPGRRARVRFTALPGESFPGRVGTINPLVDETSGTVRVTVRLENRESRVLPGMHATVRIAGRRYPGRLLVPREAIVERQGRPVVFGFSPSETAEGVGRAEWIYVSTGLENDRRVEVGSAAGAAGAPVAGEIVLVEGHTTLVDGALVRLTGLDSLPRDDG